MLKIKKGFRIKAIEIFKHKGRICVVLQMKGFGRISDYCNGYVETDPKNYGKSEDLFIDKIKTEELTYSGDLNGLFDGIWFLGFDSAHHRNEINPETKTFTFVKNKTKKLCEEMIKKGI